MSENVRYVDGNYFITNGKYPEINNPYVLGFVEYQESTGWGEPIRADVVRNILLELKESPGGSGKFLVDLKIIIRRNCPACENGAFETHLREIEELDGAGYPHVVGYDAEVIECQYCGELIREIDRFIDKNRPEIALDKVTNQDKGK